MYILTACSISETAIDTIIMRGMVAATKSRDKLIALKKSLDMDDDTPAPAARFNPYLELDTLIINKVFVEGITPRMRGLSEQVGRHRK